MAPARTLQSAVDSLGERGEKTALIALGKKDRQPWSFEKLANCSRSFANGLATDEFKPGDTIALLAENRPEWIAAALGIIRAGAVAVPLDIQLGDKTLVHVLCDSNARAVITTQQRAERIAKLDLKEKPRLILLDVGSDDERSWERFLKGDAGNPACDPSADPSNGSGQAGLPASHPDDKAVLFYTSGTTGPPKGVPLSHRNIVSQIETAAKVKIITGKDRVLLPLPLHHVYPFVIGMLAPLAIGLTLVLPFSLSGQQLLRALSEGEVTAIVGVPRLYGALYSGIEARVESSGWIARGLFSAFLVVSAFVRKWLRLRLGKFLFRSLHKRFGENLRLLASGGAALDPELASKLEALGWQVAIGYGLTETSPLLSINLPGEAPRDNVGKPFPGVKIRIDPEALEKTECINRHEVGEVLARGPNVFAGYRNLEDKTKEVFTDDGWFRTGDMGYFDEDDNLHILGRISTLIKTESGEKIQTEDVEAAYAEESAIREIGVLEEKGKLVGVIVPKHAGGGDNTNDAVRKAVEAASKRLPSHQRISDYAITPDALPRTRLGKIQRHRLAERYQQAKQGGEKAPVAGPMSIEEMSGEDRALLEDPAAQSVWDLLAKKYPDKQLTPDTSPQFDLGIDSLEWLNVTLEIGESSGVELTEEAIGRIETVRDLLREVTEGGEGESADPLEKPDEVLDSRQKQWLEPLGPIAAATARFLYAVNRVLMRVIFRLHAEGPERLPEDRQWVMTPNHVSYLDPFAIAALLDWNQLRKTYWAGWTGVIFANPVIRFLSWLGKILPVEPTRAARSSLAFGATILKSKKNLVWFPEGGRSANGKLQEFKPGIGMLLEHFPASVIPVFVHGTHEALPPGKFFPRAHAIRVALGKPIDVGELKGEGRGEKPHQQIASALQKKVARLGQGAFQD
jgi:long-chain acyl-CoA synthetase